MGPQASYRKGTEMSMVVKSNRVFPQLLILPAVAALTLLAGCNGDQKKHAVVLDTGEVIAVAADDPEKDKPLPEMLKRLPPGAKDIKYLGNRHYLYTLNIEDRVTGIERPFRFVATFSMTTHGCLVMTQTQVK